MLLKSDFKPVAKAWASFVVQTLEGTSCSSKIPLARVHTIAAIMDGTTLLTLLQVTRRSSLT